ncbi:MAG: thioesterase [Lagierella massiliensis]|nr:thioesterase [Lagierella massiliensis]
MNRIFEEQFKLYSFDERSGNVSLSKIFNILCETAYKHSKRDNNEYFDDMFWIVYRWDIKLIRKLKSNSSVKVRTEITGVRKFFALRDFTVYNENNEVCIKAKSEWILLSKLKRSPSRIPNSYLNFYNIGQVKSHISDFKVDDNLEFNNSYKRRIGPLDIDLNNHVNNVVYVELMLNSLEPNMNVEEMSIIYKKESFYGQVLNVKRSDIIKEDGKDTILFLIEDEGKNLKTIGRVLLGDNHE